MATIYCNCEVGEIGFMPVYKTRFAACADIAIPKDTIIKKRTSFKIDLDLKFDIPADCKILMYPRSSLLLKKGIISPVSVIDADYFDSVHFIGYNLNDTDIVLKRGERVAQIEIADVGKSFSWNKDNSDRIGGLGSTGCM